MQIFPFRTETFISREIDAIRATEIDVITLANQRPSDESLNSNATTEYLFPLTIPRIFKILFTHIWWLVRNFSAYVHCLRLLMQEESSDRSIWLRNAKHFTGAVYFAYIIRNRDVQHIHAHYAINAATMALMMSTLLDIPFSMTIHNIIFTDRLLMCPKLEDAKFIACISEYSRNALLSDYPNVKNLANKMIVIHCGIHADDFHVERKHNTHDGEFVIMTACQLVERKGVRYLIEACHILYQRGKQFRCIIAGSGEDYHLLKTRVSELGIDHLIEFVGVYTQTELLDYFSIANIFALPCIVSEDGDRDGIPIVLMEAMAAGVPVVSTRVSGIPELIIDGQNGHLIDERDSIALADIIQKHMDGEIDLVEQIDVARTTILNSFNMDKSVSELISCFDGKVNK